ncbi:type IV pilus assembly protein PilM [Homoserinimonas aerilata]|uniref:Type IV pilus assembly protein PilM n=1 Tax=Homoserinimonas aerilata TaxID=1162970 RepID=A0A542Y1F8_9MICO|nr:type IV pilus assembly protein PilM [Homoserinimonas aerilata]TQL41917.1 type IV pilus assembly protein PilM [Homoserinimonas aerilata]
MAKRIVGVDIGNDSIRAVEVTDAAGAKPTVERYHEVPLLDGAARSGDVLEVHTVASTLKRLWSEGGFKSKDVALGMGNQRVLARDLTVPRMPLARIRETLPFQVQDMLPVPVADALLDFYPISEGTGESGPVINGLLVAAIKEAVMANVNAVQLAGLNPVEVDLIPFALTRVHVRGENSRGTVALIDIGAQTTNVVIATNGVPQFVRIIPAGGDEITMALVQRLDMTRETAEQVKRALGIVTAGAAPEHRPAIEVIYESTGQLLNGLRNTLNYFVNSHPNDPISRIILTGGAARLPGLSAALFELTRVTVASNESFNGLRLSRAAASSTIGSEGMSVALGLALGGK